MPDKDLIVGAVIMFLVYAGGFVFCCVLLWVFISSAVRHGINTSKLSNWRNHV